MAIPQDVAVCCFGDSPYLELFEPSITAIPMPARQIGKEATRILLQQIKSAEAPDEAFPAPEHVTLPLEIISRRSW